MVKHTIVVLLLSIALFILTQQSLSSQPFKPISSHRAPKFLSGFSTSKLYHHHHRNHNHRRLERLRQYRYETQYFKQHLDHFSFLELPTFNQRYLISLEHWSGPDQLGPIFVYCGNEGDIEWFAANTGFVWEIAPSFGAMVVFPEVIRKATKTKRIVAP